VKKTLAVFVFILSIIIIVSCSNPASPPPEVLPVVPLFGFQSTQASARINVNIDSTSTYAESLYYSVAPFLTSFDMSNSSGLTVGDSYEATILGHTLTVNTEEVDGNLLFRGVFTDGSGEVTITYSPLDDKFSFEQFFVFSVKDNTGDIVGTTDYVNYAILTRGDNLNLDSDGSFQGRITSAYLSQYELTDNPLYTSTLEISGTGFSELYRGIMTPETGIGVGVAFVNDISGEPTDLLESDYLGGPDKVPTDDPDKIAVMKAYLVSFIKNDYPTLSEGNNPTLSPNGMVVYHQDNDSNFYMIEDNPDTPDYIEVQDMPSSWKEALIIPFE